MDPTLSFTTPYYPYPTPSAVIHKHARSSPILNHVEKLCVVKHLSHLKTPDKRASDEQKKWTFVESESSPNFFNTPFKSILPKIADEVNALDVVPLYRYKPLRLETEIVDKILDMLALNTSKPIDSLKFGSPKDVMLMRNFI